MARGDQGGRHQGRVVKLGYPLVTPVLPQMLDWLKSNGSPVELIMRDFFVHLGVNAVPVVKRALASRHDVLKYLVVLNVVTRRSAVSTS